MEMQDNANNYDIEALTGNESEYIEMVIENFLLCLLSGSKYNSALCFINRI